MDNAAFKGLPKAVYSLSPLDIVASHLYISNCFFFENALRKDGVELEQQLLKGLRRALRQYPILVGELKHSGLSALSIVVNPDEANVPGWETVASDITFGHLQESNFRFSEWPSELKVENALLSMDGRRQTPAAKLLCVRLCCFADNAGVAVLVRIAHAAMDAKGVVAFVNHWASSCRDAENQTVKPEALLYRDVMYRQLPAKLRPSPLPWPLYPLCLLLSLFLHTLAFCLKTNLMPGHCCDSHLFAISRNKLDTVRSEAKRSGASISDNDVIVSLFTMAYAQSMSTKPGSSKIKCMIPCDFRHRLDVPEAYVGNCAVGLFVTVPTQLLFQPVSNESLVTVALECRKTVDSADRNTIEQLIKRAMQSIRLLGSQARLLYSLMICLAFSNQSRLAFYSVNFGLGPPLFAVPVAYPPTLAVIVPSPPPSEEVYIWLSLKSKQMDHLMQNQNFRSFVERLY